MSGPEHRHEDDRTGNAMVNHGPENTPGAGQDQPWDALGAVPGEGAAAAGPGDVGGAADDNAGPAGKGGTLTDLFGGGSGIHGGGPPSSRTSAMATDLNEVALRRMLHGAVRGLEPSEGTLAQLHRAVPARRARRRQAVVGAAAAALLIGTAVPAFVHVAGTEGSTTDNPAVAGHGAQAQGGSGTETGAETESEQSKGPAEEQSEGSGEPAGSTAPSRAGGPDAEGRGPGGVVDPPVSAAAVMPVCEPSQLGVASAQSGAAGADGTVYGSFRIANVSGKDCSVTSNGTVGFRAAGAADPLRIDVVQHTEGDAAPGLPDPALEPVTVRLKPAMTYEVQFAWVPTDTCPTGGGSPSPTPSDAGGGGSSAAGAEADGPGAQFGSADEGAADGSIAVTHTPEAGAPTAETKISNACAGTIYRTGVLDAP